MTKHTCQASKQAIGLDLRTQPSPCRSEMPLTVVLGLFFGFKFLSSCAGCVKRAFMSSILSFSKCPACCNESLSCSSCRSCCSSFCSCVIPAASSKNCHCLTTHCCTDGAMPNCSWICMETDHTVSETGTMSSWVSPGEICTTMRS